MDETRAVPEGRPGEAPATAAPAAAPARPTRAVWGLLATIVIAFGTGALTYREANTLLARPVRASAAATGATALAGHQAPPAWIDEFARAFCSGDAAFVSSHVSGELDIGEERIIDAFARRTWDCASSRYLGSATNTEGQHHVYVMTGTDNGEQWFVFTVVNDKVVGID
ncbi:MAG: hypothetical protein E6H94_00480 [Chloroflexi bacterium]|nr:MAG: hypothetical protein E6H94_00480 [Chloroflexota bacterium]